MTISTPIHFFFGIALFLYGIMQMENAIKQVQARSFKLFLKKNTSTRARALASGTFMTAFFQGSSIINLTLLSFVGAGTLPLENALGTALGANIGGTFNSWLLAWAGASKGIQVLALPLVTVSGFGLVLFRTHKKYQQTLKICLGLGLLLFSLDYIRQSMQPVIGELNLRDLGGTGRLAALTTGFAITALIQTSSATVAIMMSALLTGVITLPIAISVVIGAELGTTIKIVFASLSGTKVQKQLATANVLFNLGSSIIGFVFLDPLIEVIKFTGLEAPVFILACFQTLINILSAALFLFALKPLGHFLGTRFKDHDGGVTPFLQSAVTGTPSVAAELLEKETELFINRVIAFNTETFTGKVDDKTKKDHNDSAVQLIPFPRSFSYEEKYFLLKKAEGSLLDYYSRFDRDSLSPEILKRCSKLIGAIRNAMYSAKGMKDIRTNLKEFSNSGNDNKFDLYLLFREQLEDFYLQLNLLLKEKDQSNQVSKLRECLETIKKNYYEQAGAVFQRVSHKQLKAIEIATVFNISREIFSSRQSLVLSLKDFLLDPVQVAEFDNGENNATTSVFVPENKSSY